MLPPPDPSRVTRFTPLDTRNKTTRLSSCGGGIDLWILWTWNKRLTLNKVPLGAFCPLLQGCGGFGFCYSGLVVLPFCHFAPNRGWKVGFCVFFFGRLGRLKFLTCQVRVVRFYVAPNGLVAVVSAGAAGWFCVFFLAGGGFGKIEGFFCYRLGGCVVFWYSFFFCWVAFWRCFLGVGWLTFPTIKAREKERESLRSLGKSHGYFNETL